jgi:hypothetical protein
MTTNAVAQAASGPPASVMVVYADPKKSKTSMLLRAFPNAVCIGERSAISLVAESMCGVTPPWIVENVRTIPALISWLDGFIAAGDHRRWGQMVVDDFSHIAASSMALWASEKPNDRYWPFRQLDVQLDLLALRLRETGMLCGLSAHQTAPNAEKKKIGGPSVPSDNQTQTMPGWADFVARVDFDKNYPDPLWKAVLYVDPNDTQWVTGDRTNVAWSATPPNLREILRAARGRYSLPRAPGLEWQDEWAQNVADRFAKNEPPMAIAEDMFKRFAAPVGSPQEAHALWAFQDGIARGVLAKSQARGILGRMQDMAARAQALAPPPPPAAPAALAAPAVAAAPK